MATLHGSKHSTTFECKEVIRYEHLEQSIMFPIKFSIKFGTRAVIPLYYPSITSRGGDRKIKETIWVVTSLRLYWRKHGYLHDCPLRCVYHIRLLLSAIYCARVNMVLRTIRLECSSFCNVLWKMHAINGCYEMGCGNDCSM